MYQDQPIKSDAIHLTVLEKKEGIWKIACFTMINTTAYDEAAAKEKAESVEE